MFISGWTFSTSFFIASRLPGFLSLVLVGGGGSGPAHSSSRQGLLMDWGSGQARLGLGLGTLGTLGRVRGLKEGRGIAKGNRFEVRGKGPLVVVQ